VRGLRLSLEYLNNTKYNSYDYIRRYIAGTRVEHPIIAQKPFDEKIWRNDEVRFKAIYEIFQNCYAHVDFTYNNARAYAPASTRTEGEDRGWAADGTSLNLEGDALVSYYQNKYCPAFMQGKNFMVTCGLSFGF